VQAVAFRSSGNRTLTAEPSQALAAGSTQTRCAADAVRSLRRELRLIERQLGALSDRVSDLNFWLQGLEARWRGQQLPLPPARARVHGYAVASSFKWLGGGTCEIDGVRITLGHLKACLLRILAMEQGCGPDDLVGWKSNQEIRRWLDKLTGTPSTPHGLAQLVYQLRNEMAKAGLAPSLIQSHSRLGRRLALRRPSGAPGDSA